MKKQTLGLHIHKYIHKHTDDEPTEAWRPKHDAHNNMIHIHTYMHADDVPNAQSSMFILFRSLQKMKHFIT
jgi:hypothetical protein